MDFTILAVVLLIGVGVPIRNKLIRKYRDIPATALHSVRMAMTYISTTSLWPKRLPACQKTSRVF